MSQQTNNAPYPVERDASGGSTCGSLDAAGAQCLQVDNEYAAYVGDLKKGSHTLDEEDLVAARIARLDEERAARVEKRRTELNPVQRVFSHILPYGGLRSSGFTLASSTLGAGIIALPSAFEMAGMAMAIIYLVVIALLTIYSYTLLGHAGKRTGLRNYEQITRAVLGPGADYFLAFLLWFMSFGGEVSYVISLRDVLNAFLEASPAEPDSYVRSTSGLRLITSMVWLVCMLPLTLPKEINSLRYFSVIGVSFIIFFVICMVIHAARNGLQDPNRGDLVYFQTGNTAIQALPIFIFSLLSQINAMEVYEELYKPSIRRFTMGASLGVILCLILYLLSGIFGYLDFGPAVTGSALKMYNPVKEPLMGVAYAGIIIKLCVGYGLHMIPVRDAIYHVAKLDVKTIAWWKNAVVCGFMAFCSLISGLFIPRINIVFGLVGGLCGGFIAFIFPALLFMYTGNWSIKTVGVFHYFGAYFLLIVGVIGVVFGTVSSIYGEVMASKG